MLFGTMKLAERVRLFRELTTLVKAGMSLAQALATLAEQGGGSPELRAALRDAARNVAAGKRFSEIMRRHPRVFSELQVALLAAGEQSGRLEEMLRLAADYLERELEFQQTLSRETLYPKLLLAAVILIPLGTRMIIAGLTQNANAALAIGLRFLGEVGLFVLLPAWLLYLLYKRYYYGLVEGRRLLDGLKLRVPIFGAVAMKLAWARLCRALSALYGAGVSLRLAVPLAAQTAGNRVIEDALLSCVPALERGGSLSEALAKTGQIPALALSMLRTGETTGQIDETIAKVADYFEAEAFTTIKKSMTAIVPLSVIIFGIVVFFMAAQAYGGYFRSLLNE